MTSELTDYSDLSDIYQQMGEAMSLKAEEEDAWTYEDVLNDYVLHMDEKPVYIKTGLERLDEALHISPGDFYYYRRKTVCGQDSPVLANSSKHGKAGLYRVLFQLRNQQTQAGRTSDGQSNILPSGHGEK